MKPEVTIERLEELKRVVEHVHPARWNMQTWLRPEGSCGTVGCALGHAAVDRYFVQRGLAVQNSFLGSFEPVCKGKIGAFAGAQFFGITDEEAERLFVPSEYSPTTDRDENGRVTKEAVLRRITNLIRKVRRNANLKTRPVAASKRADRNGAGRPARTSTRDRARRAA